MFSSQYSSIGLYCAGYVFDHHTGSFWLAPAHGLELLSYSFVLGSIAVPLTNWYVLATFVWACSDLILELLSCCCKGSICVDRWIAPL